MHYYIDGYNLLFRLLQAGQEVRKQREQITVELEKMVKALELNATLVFDSHYHEGESEKSHFKSLEIIFTSKGETADEFILKELKESNSPSTHTVVTSDKKLARLCQLRLGKTETVDEFLMWVKKRYKNKIKPKKPQPILPPLIRKEPPVKEQKITASLGLNTSEEYFNYYLETFEKETAKLEALTPQPKLSKEPKKVKIPKRILTKEEEQLSDYQRWLKAFDNNLF